MDLCKGFENDNSLHFPAELSQFGKPEIPATACQCKNKMIMRKGDKSNEREVVDVWIRHNGHPNKFHILKLSSQVADFNVLDALLNEIMNTSKEKKLPGPKFVSFAQGYSEIFLRLHPMCESHTQKDYLKLLEDSDRFRNLFEEMMTQADPAFRKVMPVAQRKARKNNSDEDSSADEDKTYVHLSPSEKLDQLFPAFTFFVKILEKDFELWKVKVSSGSTNSKYYRPLIVQLVWKDIRRFDKAATLNRFCSQILKFFRNLAHINAPPTHLRASARLVNLIGEIIELIARHQEYKADKGLYLDADFSNFCYMSRQSGFNSFALKEIKNVRMRVHKPKRCHCDNPTAINSTSINSTSINSTSIGDLCQGFANAFANTWKRCPCEDVKECLVLRKALFFIKLPWLFSSDDSQKRHLRLIRSNSTVDTLQMLGYRTERPKEDVKRVSKRIKLNSDANDDVEDVIALMKSQSVRTF